MKSYIENFKKYRFLLWELVKKGVKLKYRRSYLGILWTLLEPLMTMIVLSVVFGTLFGNKDPHFPVYILCGRLMYSFFSSATNGAMKAIRTNAGMIKKVYVPKYIYPLSSVLFNYIIFAISLIVLVVVSIVLKVYPTIYLAQAIIPLILLLITAFGVGMILSTMAVFFRDLEYLWSVGLMIIMYASAIFYKPEKLLKSGFGWILKCNPLYLLIHNFRQAVFGMPMNMKFLAASIVFAIMVIAGGGDISLDLFHIVFMVALLSVAFQGTLIPKVAEKLDMVDNSADVSKTFNDYQEESAMTLMRMYIPKGHNWENHKICEVSIPTGALALMIKRDGDTMIPNGDTRILAEDSVILSVPAYESKEDEHLEEVLIEKNNPWCEQRIRELNLPQNQLIALVKRGEENLIPSGSTKIHEGDIVVLYR